MNRETKKRLFQVLVDVGLKEIEVGFPAASDTDFRTVRARDYGVVMPRRMQVEFSALVQGEADGTQQGVELDITLLGKRRHLRGVGNGPIAAAVNALALPLRIDNYEERALGHGADASALAIVEAARDGVPGNRFGAGRHANIVTASVLAILNAARRLGFGAQDMGYPAEERSRA